MRDGFYYRVHPSNSPDYEYSALFATVWRKIRFHVWPCLTMHVAWYVPRYQPMNAPNCWLQINFLVSSGEP